MSSNCRSIEWIAVPLPVLKALICRFVTKEAPVPQLKLIMFPGPLQMSDLLKNIAIVCKYLLKAFIGECITTLELPMFMWIVHDYGNPCEIQ